MIGLYFKFSTTWDNNWLGHAEKDSAESVPHSAAENNNGSSRRISENQGLYGTGCRAGNADSRWNASLSAYIRRLWVTSRHLNKNPSNFPLPRRSLFLSRWSRSRVDLKSVAKGGPPHFAWYYLAPRVIPLVLPLLLTFPSFHSPCTLMLFLFLFDLHPDCCIVFFYKVVRAT